MRNLKELKEAISSKATLVWNDPDPIDENDYTISFIEPLGDIEDDEDIFDRYDGDNYIVTVKKIEV